MRGENRNQKDHWERDGFECEREQNKNQGQWNRNRLQTLQKHRIQQAECQEWRKDDESRRR